MLCASPRAELGQRDQKLRLLRVLAPQTTALMCSSAARARSGAGSLSPWHSITQSCALILSQQTGRTPGQSAQPQLPTPAGRLTTPRFSEQLQFCGFQRHPCTKMSHGRDAGRLGGLRLRSCKDLPCKNPSVGKGSRSETPHCAELRGVCGWQSWERPLPACPGMCCCKIAGV